MRVKKPVTKIEVWSYWMRGYSVEQIGTLLKVQIKIWPGSIATLHQDIYDGKFDIAYN